MANRVAIGRRSSSNSDRGFNVSGLTAGSLTSFADVTTSSAPHNFDSSDVVGGGLSVFLFGQGQISAPTTFDGVETTINHNWASMVLGDNDSTKLPLFSVRWCFGKDLSSGLATQVYHPNYYFAEHEEETDNCEEEEEGNEVCETVTFLLQEGIGLTVNPNEMKITNLCCGVEDGETSVLTGAKSIYYSYVIFHQEDFTNGKGI